jgi:preprotein translocase subunit SecF
MPPKSRNSRGKQTHQSRKSKAKQRQGLAVAKPETSMKSTQTIKSPEVRQAATATKTQTMVYPYVTGELKRIGVLAAIIIVILIILVIVIP